LSKCERGASSPVLSYLRVSIRRTSVVRLCIERTCVRSSHAPIFRSWYHKPLVKEREFKVMTGDQLPNGNEEYIALLSYLRVSIRGTSYDSLSKGPEFDPHTRLFSAHGTTNLLKMNVLSCTGDQLPNVMEEHLVYVFELLPC
jgi:hypothetical protein